MTDNGLKTMTLKPTNLLILYGTSTGTAREVALRIARESYSFSLSDQLGEGSFPLTHYFQPEVLSMRDVSVHYIAENWKKCDVYRKKVIFIVSTIGQGEFPEDAKKLWRELCRKTEIPEILIEYAVIGLGDSSYEYYNYPGKKLHRRLQQLAAIPAFDVCLCDDQHDLGYVGALNSFLEGCWEVWVPAEYKVSRNSKPVARYSLTCERNECQREENETSVNIQKRSVIRNDRVTSSDHNQDTRLIAFDTVGSNLKFEEGDVVQVYAENFPENVDTFFEIFPQLQNQPPFYVLCDPEMSWEAIPPALFKVVGPQPWTWEMVATQLVDLQSIPGVYTFEILRSFAVDPLLQEKFDELCRPEGLEELYNYVNRPRRTVLEVLQDFPSLVSNIPANYIFDLIPFLRPRAFSIASPPKETQHIEILVAVVEYRTNLKKSRKGFCSYWLAHHCSIGKSVAIYCEKGSLRPPPTSQSHVIMIGPGTGVAPFRSMIKQHLTEWDKHLIFGCRNKEKDFYFAEEYDSMTTEGHLSLYTAFSRDNAGRKVDYVQDVLSRQTDLIKNMLASSLPLFIYVCGRSGEMPKDVYNTFKEILQKIGIVQPENLLKQMLNTGQYQTETY